MFSVTVDILWDESHLTVQCEPVTTLLVCDDTNFFPILLDKKKKKIPIHIILCAEHQYFK